MEKENRKKQPENLRGGSARDIMPEFDEGEIWDMVCRKLDAHAGRSEAEQEQDWKELSEQLAAIPDDDDNLTWDETPEEVSRETRRRRLFIPLRYAAALVAGIVMIGFAIHYLQDRKQVTIPIAKTTDTSHFKTHDEYVLPPSKTTTASDSKTVSLSPQPNPTSEKTHQQPMQVKNEKPASDTTAVVSNQKEEEGRTEPIVRYFPLVAEDTTPARAIHLNEIGERRKLSQPVPLDVIVPAPKGPAPDPQKTAVVKNPAK